MVNSIFIANSELSVNENAGQVFSQLHAPDRWSEHGTSGDAKFATHDRHRRVHPRRRGSRRDLPPAVRRQINRAQAATPVGLALIGNIIGRTELFALLAYAQVRQEL